MSFAVHLFMTEKFSEQSYRGFLDASQNLFGKWNFEETVPFNEDPGYLTIHECWIKSCDTPSNERFRVNIEANKHLKDVVVWDFDYEWHLGIETAAGRPPLALAVQLGTWLLASRRFRFSHAINRDSYLKNEPTEFRSPEALAEHVKRLFQELPLPGLKKRGILNKEGYISIPADLT